MHGLTAGGLAPIKMKEDSVLVDDGGDSERPRGQVDWGASKTVGEVDEWGMDWQLSRSEEEKIKKKEKRTVRV